MHVSSVRLPQHMLMLSRSKLTLQNVHKIITWWRIIRP